MPSDSVTSFFDKARASRLILPDQVDDLFRRPDIPQENLASVCDFLRDRGLLTAYQADLIRAGRLPELTFAGYPVVGELGPCPGGTAYRALHPSLRTPVVLRRIRPDFVGGADNVAAFVQRAQAACPVAHPHLAHLLDAGVYLDEPYATLEPFDGADLKSLVADIGPMPTALAATYCWQVAAALKAAHDHGLVHGAVGPEVIGVGPLVRLPRPRPDGTPRYRPTSTATARLFELGLIPHTGAAPTAADDVAGLGATMYYLLTGRERTADASPLDRIRPDVPADLAALVHEMTAADPAARPTAAVVFERLGPFAPAGAAPPVPEPVPAPGSEAPVGFGTGTGPSGLSSVPGFEFRTVPPGGSDAPPEWVVQPYQGTGDSNRTAFTPPAYPAAESSEFAAVLDAAPARPPKPDDDVKASRVWMWVAIGAGLNLLAIAGWLYLMFAGGCSGKGS